MTAANIIADVRQLFAGDPVFMAGSLVAADTYGMGDTAWSDVDLFCPSAQVLISTGQKMLDNGFKLDERYSRVWYRWLKYGFNKWHTNSLRIHDPNGIEFNLVYKLNSGHPTTSLSQVLESFDFGLLGTGWDLEQDTFRDLRGYLFPDAINFGALPMMPDKRENWRQGFISQYNGLREAGRYAKYHDYGYDMSEVKDDLTTGYWEAASYLGGTFDQDKQMLGKIYETIALKIESDAIDELAEAYRQLDFKDSLDSIMETLE